MSGRYFKFSIIVPGIQNKFRGLFRREFKLWSILLICGNFRQTTVEAHSKESLDALAEELRSRDNKDLARIGKIGRN
jgi:hypothetical protein